MDVSDGQIDAWHTAGRRSGALGGNLLGAGLGEFLLFFASPDRHAEIQRGLGDLQPVDFRFDRTGTQIVFYNPARETSASAMAAFPAGPTWTPST